MSISLTYIREYFNFFFKNFKNLYFIIIIHSIPKKYLNVNEVYIYCRSVDILALNQLITRCVIHISSQTHTQSLYLIYRFISLSTQQKGFLRRGRELEESQACSGPLTSRHNLTSMFTRSYIILSRMVQDLCELNRWKYPCSFQYRIYS